MSTKTKRFILPESEIPTRWYNVMADMPNNSLCEPTGLTLSFLK